MRLPGFRQFRAAGDEEASAWRAARDADTALGYRRFLLAYPDSAFQAEARDRLGELDNLSDGEAELGLTPFTLRLIETGLARMGFDPGPQDGDVDAQTRSALAAFQRANGVSPTGYFDRQTLAKLVANGLEAVR